MKKQWEEPKVSELDIKLTEEAPNLSGTGTQYVCAVCGGDPRNDIGYGDEWVQGPNGGIYTSQTCCHCGSHEWKVGAAGATCDCSR